MRHAFAFKVAALAICSGLPVPAIVDPLPLVPFLTTETGQMRDPTDLWTPAEGAEGGSDVQPSVWYAHFSVLGGEVTLAVLGHVDRWRSQRRIDVMSIKPRKLSAVLS